MSNKDGKLLKSNLMKKLSVRRPSGSSSSIYSGVASGQRSIQKPGSSYSLRSNLSKRTVDRSVTYVPENPIPPPRHHPWEMEYSQIFTREKIKKSMTKNPYTIMTCSVAHAIESIITQDECCPALLPADTVHIENPIVHLITTPPLGGTVRYLRYNEPMPSERVVSQTSMKNSSLSQYQIETKTAPPVINTKKLSGITSTLATTDRLLNRVRVRNDAPVIIRRPPRRLIINTTYQTIMPMATYG